MRRLLVCSIIVKMFGTAHADSNDIIARPLVLAPGQIEGHLVGEIDETENYVEKPISLAPDLWVGVLPKLTIGLIHSNASVDRITSGASFCIHTGGSPPAECDHLYHGSGLDLLWSEVSGQFAVAPRIRFLIRDLDPDPFKPAVTLGAAIRWTHGRYAIAGDPYLQIGLKNTEEGNRAALWLPVVFSIQPTCRWAIDLTTGWNSDLAVWQDGWHVPAEVGVRVRATMHLDLSAAYGFTTILGPLNTPKERVLFVTAGWRT